MEAYLGLTRACASKTVGLYSNVRRNMAGDFFEVTHVGFDQLPAWRFVIYSQPKSHILDAMAPVNHLTEALLLEVLLECSHE